MPQCVAQLILYRYFCIFYLRNVIFISSIDKNERIISYLTAIDFKCHRNTFIRFFFYFRHFRMIDMINIMKTHKNISNNNPTQETTNVTKK